MEITAKLLRSNKLPQVDTKENMTEVIAFIVGYLGVTNAQATLAISLAQNTILEHLAKMAEVEPLNVIRSNE